ncbi:16S rRNA processing protein RimM [Roseivivax lentus]|uniref:Ribosome maturation factor RimM n=1 Tax=Roseivivax lentus TaxID=633194 RepID=A0A1N7ME80_9RHOB|nr:ribosome maturation factor RimM [Roseivivax lentus]SIS84348.1 16S rRNA processing protein RimM [Roseivivax lentus]
MSEERICVGVLGGAFGVAGEVRLKSFTAEPEAIADYGPFETEDASRSFDMQIVRPVKQGFAVRLSGVRSKEDADALKGTQLFVPRARLPQLPDDEFYHADLIGLAVMDTGGAPLGTVRAVLNHGAADLLEITRPGSAQTALLPFTQTIVPTVDLTAGKIVVEPPEGLFD